MINQELSDPSVTCIRGHEVRVSKAVIFDEEVSEVIMHGLFSEEDLKYIYGVSELHLVNAKLRENDKRKVRGLTLVQLLNKEFLEAKDENTRIKLLNVIYTKLKDKFIPTLAVELLQNLAR